MSKQMLLTRLQAQPTSLFHDIKLVQGSNRGESVNSPAHTTVNQILQKISLTFHI